MTENQEKSPSTGRVGEPKEALSGRSVALLPIFHLIFGHQEFVEPGNLMRASTIGHDRN